MQKPISRAGLLIGLGLLLAAAVIGYDAVTMNVPAVHAKVGPRVFPTLVSIGLAVAAIAHFWQCSRGQFHEAEGTTDWFAVGTIAAALVIHMNILKPLGFLPAGIFLFTMVAFAFGSRRLLRDVVVGIVVVGLTYFAFTRFLGLQLPPGILGWIV